MSKNYAMVNGVKIELPDDVDELTFTKKSNENPFYRVKNNEYFYIDGDKLNSKPDVMLKFDDEHFNSGNYCTDKELMRQRMLHEKLNRLLWKYSGEHGGDNEWDNYKYHWSIAKNEGSKIFSVGYNTIIKYQGFIYFKDEETAQAAIRDVVIPFMEEHPNFVW